MYAEIDILVHATEDMDKILNSLLSVLKIKEYRINRSDLTGHYKNPLIYLKIKIRSGETKEFLKNLLSKLDKWDKEYLVTNLDEYIDRRRFYIRIEKNYLCKGKVKLASRDPIKITFYNIDKKQILTYC